MLSCLNATEWLQILQIIVTVILAVLALFIPSKLQKGLYNKNLIKDNFQKDVNNIIERLLNIDNLLKAEKLDKKTIMHIFKDIGFLVDFLFSDIRQKVYFLRKQNKEVEKLIETIKIKHLDYKRTVTEDLPKENFKTDEDFLRRCNDKKNLFIKALKKIIYSASSV